MEQEKLLQLLPNYGELVNEIRNEFSTKGDKTKEHLDEFNPKKHKIADKTKRPDKTIQVTSMVDGTSEIVTKVVPVARLTLPLQKKIVNLAAAFLCGNPIKLANQANGVEEENMVIAVQDIWNDNKLDYDSKKIAKILMAETEVAELWYTEKVEPGYWEGSPLNGAQYRLRMKILANSKGDKLYPLINESGDMIAFARGYSRNIEGSEVECLDVYTDTNFYYGVKRSTWEVESEQNMIGKIPIIYYSQDQPEWSDVQECIDRLELLMSNHADSNDYFGSPMVKVTGQVKDFSAKGEQGKVLELEEGSDADYLTWDQAPASMELEYKWLRSMIFDMTDTPDISIEQMQSLGTYSGIALKMLFMNAHLKAADKEENFGKGIQRRINYIKQAATKIKISTRNGARVVITPQFEYFLPKNDQEKIEQLSLATGSKPILSQKSAIKQNPLVEDWEQELEDIKNEAEENPKPLNDNDI